MSILELFQAAIFRTERVVVVVRDSLSRVRARTLIHLLNNWLQTSLRPPNASTSFVDNDDS